MEGARIISLLPYEGNNTSTFEEAFGGQYSNLFGRRNKRKKLEAQLASDTANKSNAQRTELEKIRLANEDKQAQRDLAIAKEKAKVDEAKAKASAEQSKVDAIESAKSAEIEKVEQEKEKKGSTKKMIMIGVGGLVLVGGIIFFATR